MEITTRTIGNDEGDVYCDVCERKEWFTAVEIRFISSEGEMRKVICLHRYEGQSCADAIMASLL